MTMFSGSMLMGIGENYISPTYVDSTANFVTSATSNSVSAPAGLASGDLEVAFCYSGESTRTWTAPGGWTLVSSRSVANASLAVFKKVAGGSEPGSYSFSLSGVAGNNWCSIFAYRGATDVIQEGLTGATIANADPQVAASLNVSQGRILLAALFANSNSVTLTTGPSGMTSREQQFSSSFPRGAIYELVNPSTAASGTKSFDLSASFTGTAFLLEIQ